MDPVVDPKLLAGSGSGQLKIRYEFDIKLLLKTDNFSTKCLIEKWLFLFLNYLQNLCLVVAQLQDENAKVKNIRTNSCRIWIRGGIRIRNHLKSRIQIRNSHSRFTILLDGIHRTENSRISASANVAGTQPDTSLKVPRFTWPRIARPHTTDR